MTSAEERQVYRQYKHRNAKLWIWLIWMVTMAASAAYCVVTVFTFRNVLDVYEDKDHNVEGETLRAFLASTILAPGMVIGFFFFGTFTLLITTISEAGLTYSFGALHVSCLWMAALVLLAAVTTHAFKDEYELWEKGPGVDLDNVTGWGSGDSLLAKVSYGMGYGLGAVYLALYLLIAYFRGAVQRLVIDPKVLAARQKAEEKQSTEKIPIVDETQPVSNKPASGPVTASLPESQTEEKKPWWSRSGKSKKAGATAGNTIDGEAAV